MSAWGGLILIATGVAIGYPTGWIVCFYQDRQSRIRARDNIRRIRAQEQTLVVEIAALEKENAELRDLLQWDRSLGEAS